MRAYTAFASVYDTLGLARVSQAVLEQALGLECPPGWAADLGCGTGEVAIWLAASGWHVVGIDQSPEMVRISEGRTRDAHQDVRFIRGDFLQLLLRPTELVGADGGMVPDTFDLVTCLGGTLCELTGATDLLAVLQRVAAVLAPGGRLIFDTFSEAEFATWDAADMVLHDRDGLLVYQRRAYNWNTTIATCRTVWFAREEDLWWRAEEQYRLRCWSKVQILSALEHAGLILTALLELSLPGERWARTIYCVQRKVV